MKIPFNYMQIVPYSMYEPFIAPALTMFCYWLFFIKNNFFYLRKQPLNVDKNRATNFLKKTNYKLGIRIGLLYNIFYFLSFFTMKSTTSTFWWGHCFLTNSNISIMYYAVVINLLLMILLNSLKHQNLSLNIEYVFSLLNLNVVVVWIFAANTLFTLIFILELISSIVFYKFSVSNFWFNKNIKKISTTKFTKNASKYYINILFFQYWVSFFSSILIFYSLINVISMYGSSDWTTMNFLQNIDFSVNYFTRAEVFFVIFPLFFGIFLKLGITPIHFYKIEVYKGLPFVSILYYTTYYFFIFILFFIYFFASYLTNFYFWSWLFLMLILSFGMLYLLSLLFDGYLIRSFFAYSTLINTMNLILIALYIHS